MTIKYANGWWGIYGADPYHVPKFKKFIDAIRWAKEHRGLEAPRLRDDYETVFPNRVHIVINRSRTGFVVSQGDCSLLVLFGTLPRAMAAAHQLAATTR